MKEDKRKTKGTHRHNHAHHNHASHDHQHKPHAHKHKSHDHKHTHHDHDHDHDHAHDNHWLKATLGLIWGIGLLVLSVSGFSIPIAAYYTITGLTSLMTLYLGHTVYQSAWSAVREQKWTMSELYTISTLTILMMSLASLFIPGLPMMFEAAPLVLGFWHLGEGIEHTLKDQINEKLEIRACLPSSVTRIVRGRSELAAIEELALDDIVVVQEGEVIPVDGILTTNALLYTTRVDGNGAPKFFNPGDEVQSGMRLADENSSSLQMRVTKTYEHSYLSLIAKNIAQAHETKAPVEVFADKILSYFVPGLLATAVVSGLVIGSLFGPALAIQCLISVLVSACPCALKLITPTAVKIGMKKASENGIQFKNGQALQAAADIDAIVFDLNGTLTKGEIMVEALQISDKGLLGHIALLESHSKHPVAKVIAAHIRTQDTVVNEALEIQSLDKDHHAGISAVINGETFMVGNKKMLATKNINDFDAPYNNPDNGSIYIVRGEKVIGQIALKDPLRDDAVATVNQLKQLGKAVYICTGADKQSAEKYAKELGIPTENICTNAVGVPKPNEVSKQSYIEQLRTQGLKVAMVGDAANDAEAIAYSDIGIAVKSSIGDNSAEKGAGIVVQKGLLFPIATAFDVAQKTTQNITQNLFVSLGYNSTVTLVASGLFAAVGFTLNPAVGIALMILESTVVLTNLIRFKHQEVVVTPLQDNPVIRNEAHESTTSRILNALDHQPKLQETVVHEPEETFQPILINRNRLNRSRHSTAQHASNETPKIGFSRISSPNWQ